jgi:hypothetical protein
VFCSVQSAMEDVEVALLMSLYVVLVKTFCMSQALFAVDDDILLEFTVDCGTSFDSHYSPTANVDYQILAELICF